MPLLITYTFKKRFSQTKNRQWWGWHCLTFLQIPSTSGFIEDNQIAPIRFCIQRVVIYNSGWCAWRMSPRRQVCSWDAKEDLGGFADNMTLCQTPCGCFWQGWAISSRLRYSQGCHIDEPKATAAWGLTDRHITHVELCSGAIWKASFHWLCRRTKCRSFSLN